MSSQPGNGPDLRSFGPEQIREWRRGDAGRDRDRELLLASGNGTTAFGAVLGGTLLSKLSSGKWRPCGKSFVSGAQPGVNEIQMAAGGVANFYVGDVVRVVRPSTGAVVFTGRTLTATDKAGHKATVSGGAVSVEDGDRLELVEGGTAKRILHESTSTTYFNPALGTLAETDRICNGACSADVRDVSLLVGWNTATAADLPMVTVD